MAYIRQVFFFFISVYKIHFTQNAMWMAIYFRQEVVYSLYQENNPTFHMLCIKTKNKMVAMQLKKIID